MLHSAIISPVTRCSPQQVSRHDQPYQTDLESAFIYTQPQQSDISLVVPEPFSIRAIGSQAVCKVVAWTKNLSICHQLSVLTSYLCFAFLSIWSWILSEFIGPSQLGKDSRGTFNEASSFHCRADKTANVHVGIGKVSFPTEHIQRNFGVLANALLNARPKGVKGSGANGYILGMSLSSTMGRGIPITMSSLLTAVQRGKAASWEHIVSLACKLKNAQCLENVVEITVWDWPFTSSFLQWPVDLLWIAIAACVVDFEKVLSHYDVTPPEAKWSNQDVKMLWSLHRRILEAIALKLLRDDIRVSMHVTLHCSLTCLFLWDTFCYPTNKHENFWIKQWLAIEFKVAHNSDFKRLLPT